MKAGEVLLISGIIVIAVGLAWLILGIQVTDLGPGSIAPGSSSNLPQTNSPPNTTGTIPEGTLTSTPTARPSPTLSSDEIRQHFLDLAFGAGNANLERWDAVRNNGRIVISVTGNRDADTSLLENTVREFNDLSRTNQISTQIKQTPTGDIMLKFIPESAMSGIPLNTSERQTNREIITDGVTLAKITKGVIYINANLRGDERNHTIIRTLYHELGAVGETNAYSDSLFFSGANTNTNLTALDREAIRILYSNSLTPGMNAGAVKDILYIR
ncbi:MAG TPA: DUF2927 domain-containing protein [Methanoregula sp.]|nr:DUF2927 domain-containing protein [Methanoregula sp.]